MRPPAVAGRFYPDDPDELEDMISWCFRHRLGPGEPRGTGSERSIRAAMAPHAGYMCSGMTAAHTYRAMAEDGLPDVYVVIGPDHYGAAMGGTVLCSEDFLTPLGVCRTDREVCSRLARRFPDVPRAHAREHAVEVQVPFIQTIDPDPAIVAVTMGDQSPPAAAELASAVAEACADRDAVVIASTDMSHYIPKAEAAELDGAVLDRVAAMDARGMYDTVYGRRVSMCGYGPTAAAMLFSGDASAEVLRRTDSHDALGGSPDAVVGYASAVFRGRAPRGQHPLNRRPRRPPILISARGLSSMSDNQNFCVHCGQTLAVDAKFCPACGTRVPGRNQEQVMEERQAVRDVVKSRLNWAVALMLIYSIPFLIIGAYLLVDLDGIVNMIMTDPLYADYVDYYGWTYDQLHEVFQYAGYAYILSSVCGIISAVLCYRKTMYWVALILCIVSMFTGAMGLFALFMGMFAFWIILTSRLGFREYQDQFEEELNRIQ